MSNAEPAPRLDGVQAQLNYLAPESAINRRYVAPGAEMNTGRYEAHAVFIANARTGGGPFLIDTQGFTLLRHRSAVRDFRDKSQIDAIYGSEIIALVKEVTAADRFMVMGSVLRTAGDTSAGEVQPPASDVHVDISHERARATGERLYQRMQPGGPGFSRFIAFSCWRALSPPPQDWPLTLCDARSVAADEGIPNIMVVVDRLPDAQAALGDVAGESQLPAASVFRFSPHHRWWYFPDMTLDEILVFKLHDSDHSHAWRAPHTAFHDSSRAHANVRESIEMRVVAFFD
jgi:hypothetical protein